MSYLTFFLLFCIIGAVAWIVGFVAVWDTDQIRKFLRTAGAPLNKINRTILEMERKTFHLCGLLVPWIYHLMLRYGLTQKHGIMLSGSITAAGWTFDICRVYIPGIRRFMPFQHILRDDEQNQITGACFFSLGCFSVILLFPPKIAICCHLWLVLGDLSAAIIGISFGRVKIGRKSLEGSTAMFIVCVMIGSNIFWHVHMREYAVVCGALVATLVELYEPFGISDNLTIPLCSGIALKWGLARLATCTRLPDSLMYFAENVDPNFDGVNEVDFGFTGPT